MLSEGNRTCNLVMNQDHVGILPAWVSHKLGRWGKIASPDLRYCLKISNGLSSPRHCSRTMEELFQSQSALCMGRKKEACGQGVAANLTDQCWIAFQKSQRQTLSGVTSSPRHRRQCHPVKIMPANKRSSCEGKGGMEQRTVKRACSERAHLNCAG